MHESEPSRQILVGLIPGLSLAESPAEFAIVSEYGRYPVPAPGAAIQHAMRSLAAGNSTESELGAGVLETGGLAELTRFNFIFQQCALRCFLRYTVREESAPILSMNLTVPQRRFSIEALDQAVPYRLSRFAYSHRESEGLLLETPLFGATVSLSDWRASALLALLSEPGTPAELVTRATFLSAESAVGALELLKAAHLLEPAADEEADIPLRQWEFHDLLFHSRSRIGRHNHRIGATFRHLGSIAPSPLIKSRIEDTVPLPAPNTRSNARNKPREVSLFEAIDSRRSIRQHGDEPITIEELSEFLYRVARIRAFWDFEIKNPQGERIESVELSNRPYPSGGAIYEMEMYLTIDRCQGLDPGLYRYRPLDHSLVRISGANDKTASLQRDACMAAAIDQKPQVLITLASRFQRMSWKYAAISYAATLKNVGVLYQTMYLVATGMGLAACGLGSGNSDLFADAAGTNYYAETSVGEFMLGSMPDAELLPPWIDQKEIRRNDALPAFA